ncbi:HAMP domain-containing histidine kinase [Clostridium botulinum D/C]|uniref:HAMP domain-containing sensor histidine kinase n=1 Tax=Clostridium botulinum TaxID=1491 RepID=UPI001E40E11A|nr:HAMP domain-containing sensor histidine kinase [Clostridium botulinum]MCD3351221.1 HAMP domain-containing histidine kinase [Clostridium botulinum D/C]MCD3360178.1 HAMP domain-containing histidine kinase [Clostridium botulinum D/C]MCD3362553.1 HAMP domain-containing histidine kinase [Clostridium botulinum D/C]MCD3365984.1 HAMP domain-containing histidine kinase [Clostridium botulinum D/C]
MRIKNWIIGSYIIVMILPIIIGIAIYNGIKFCSEKVELEYYLNSVGIADKYENRLRNISIYEKVNKNLKLVDDEDKELIEMEVYDKYGTIMYSTKNYSRIINSIQSEELYKDLYTIKREVKFNIVKKPVLNNGDIVGFYKIKILKGNVIKNINYVTYVAIGCFIFAVIVIFIVTIHFLNNKILKPITFLVNDMKRYSRGENSSPFKYNKNDEIGDLINHFNNLKENIQKKQYEIEKQHKDKEYLIAAISHDLKTPLTSIRAYSEAIYRYENLKESDIKEYSSIIINKSDYIKKMLEDLLAYTLLTSEEKLNLVNVEGEEFLEMLFYGYDELCEKNDIILKKSICVLGNYNVDVNSMIRVIDNLVSNSIRYARNGGEIYLGAYCEEVKLPSFLPKELIEEVSKKIKDNMFIFVSNDGGHIPKEEQEKIFKAFYQSDSSRNKEMSGGVGLGLSIVKLIMDKHDGSIKIFSNESFGTLIGCFIKRIT